MGGTPFSGEVANYIKLIIVTAASPNAQTSLLGFGTRGPYHMYGDDGNIVRRDTAGSSFNLSLMADCMQVSMAYCTICSIS